MQFYGLSEYGDFSNISFNTVYESVYGSSFDAVNSCGKTELATLGANNSYFNVVGENLLCDNVWAFDNDPEFSRFAKDSDFDGKMAVWT